jgi:four helix bundle protein
MPKYDLEDRLIQFSVSIIEISKIITSTPAGKHLASQIVRSGTSPALNYGEAQAAESRKDFVHKMKIALKELRETLVCLKIIHQAQLCKDILDVEKAKKENNELISIFVKSIATASQKHS